MDIRGAFCTEPHTIVAVFLPPTGQGEGEEEKEEEQEEVEEEQKEEEPKASLMIMQSYRWSYFGVH